MARREGRRTDQQNEVGSADTNPSIYNQLTFHEGASPSFPNYPGTTAGGPHAKQWSQTPPPSPTACAETTYRASEPRVHKAGTVRGRGRVSEPL